MKIAIISYYKSDFDALVKELVENEGFTTDIEFTWVKESKNIPNGILFDHVIVEQGSEAMYSAEDLEKLKAAVPRVREKFSEDPQPEEQKPVKKKKK